MLVLVLFARAFGTNMAGFVIWESGFGAELPIPDSQFPIL